MAKQTIKQRKALKKVKGSLRRGAPPPSPASKPSASLPPDRISVLWDFDEYPKHVDVHHREGGGSKRYYPVDTSSEGQAEALREGSQHRSQSILSIFRSFIAKWWKR